MTRLVNERKARLNGEEIPMTEKDKKDIIFAIENKVDYIALSFVRTAEDVTSAKEYITKHGGDQWIIAKIEKPEALNNIESIEYNYF